MKRKRLPWTTLNFVQSAGLVATLTSLCIFASGPSAQAQGSTPTVTSAPPVSSSLLSADANSSSSPSPDGPVTLVAEAPLPEAPVPQVVPVKPAATAPGGEPVAPLRAIYIPAGWRAQPLAVGGKVAVGISDLVSFDALAGVVISAGYEQLINSQPNYGTNEPAFGKRVGAAAARESSQLIFTDMVFASMLREDPRYYQEGDGHNFIHRTLYAVTRPLITRTDSGKETINGALLLGYAASAAITPAYYPSINRNFHDAVSTYGGGIGGAALGFFVSEFSDDVLEALHLKHQP